MNHGFDFVCDGLFVKNVMLTHKPCTIMQQNCINIHGHLHNLGYGDMASFDEDYSMFDDGRHMRSIRCLSL